MIRFHLARFALVASILSLSGCSTCSPCGGGSDRPGLLTRFRMAINPNPVVISSGDCCDSAVTGPMLPGSAPANVLPPPQQNIPRIDENGKQMPWDPKTSRQGTKTSNDVKTTKEGT